MFSLILISIAVCLVLIQANVPAVIPSAEDFFKTLEAFKGVDSTESSNLRVGHPISAAVANLQGAHTVASMMTFIGPSCSGAVQMASNILLNKCFPTNPQMTRFVKASVSNGKAGFNYYSDKNCKKNMKKGDNFPINSCLSSEDFSAKLTVGSDMTPKISKGIYYSYFPSTSSCNSNKSPMFSQFMATSDNGCVAAMSTGNFSSAITCSGMDISFTNFPEGNCMGTPTTYMMKNNAQCNYGSNESTTTNAYAYGPFISCRSK